MSFFLLFLFLNYDYYSCWFVVNWTEQAKDYWTVEMRILYYMWLKEKNKYYFFYFIFIRVYKKKLFLQFAFQPNNKKMIIKKNHSNCTFHWVVLWTKINRILDFKDNRKMVLFCLWGQWTGDLVFFLYCL